MKPISVKEEPKFKLNNTRRSNLCQTFDFAFLNLYLNLLNHSQGWKLKPIIIQIGTNYKHTSTTTNASIINRAKFCPDFIIA